VAFLTRESPPEARRDNFWTIFRRFVIILVPLLAVLFLFVTLASIWILSSVVPEWQETMYPNLRQAYQPLTEADDPLHGIFHHPTSLLPFLVEVGFATAFWAFAISVSYIAYFVHDYQNLPRPRRQWWLTSLEGVLARSFRSTFERLFIRMRWWLLLSEFGFVCLLFALTCLLGRFQPHWSVALVWVPVTLGFFLVISVSDATGFTRFLRPARLVVAAYARRDTSATGNAERQILVEDATRRQGADLPASPRPFTFPMFVIRAGDVIGSFEETIEQTLAGRAGLTLVRAERQTRDDIVIFGDRVFRVLRWEVLVENDGQPAAGRYLWIADRDLVANPEIDPELRSVLLGDGPDRPPTTG
jgi:hypothetical protein